MPKLNEVDADRVSGLYNSLMVAEVMLRHGDREEEDYYKRWQAKARLAASQLRAEFGIRVVGF